MTKKLTNTKRKVWVVDLTDLGGGCYMTKKLTIWQSHTGVECVKWFGDLHKIKPMTPQDKACGAIPYRVSHKLGRKYKVPSTSTEKTEQAMMDALVDSVVPLNFDKDTRRVFKKLPCEQRHELRERLIAALLDNL